MSLHQNNKWDPVVGRETKKLLEYKFGENKNAIEKIERSTLSILKHSVFPNKQGSETGLVVGYVQSGKTLSFTTLAALAHDNKYQLIIIISGSSILLSEQSKDRLKQDLQISTNYSPNWAHYHNPEKKQQQDIQSVIDDWQDEFLSSEVEHPSLLITVMKNHIHLKKLTFLLRELNLEGVSAIVIDDEADQASLNTNAEDEDNDPSTTYRVLGELRAHLSSHTFLQYTATPQAPLLINIIDVLSPNFVVVLEPGDGYVGGKFFFQNGVDEHIEVIPYSDVPMQENLLTGAPESLRKALRIFILGVAAGIINKSPGNRSMVVHPSHRIIQHQEFYTWVQDIVYEWGKLLNRPEDSDYDELINHFEISYQDLVRTTSDLPPFENLKSFLNMAVRRTRIHQVNSTTDGTREIDWSQQYAWILVGGQSLDRGFTVEGLTVTYMPRGIGVGNVDTIQQRARFFGYKKNYIGYCRVFLEEGTLNAFKQYVEHEEFMRNELQKIQREEILLNEWKRVFMLGSELRPCRQNVLSFDYIRTQINQGWYFVNTAAMDDDLLNNNRNIVKNFLFPLNLQPDSGHEGRTQMMKHQVDKGVSLKIVLENFLIKYKADDLIDSQTVSMIYLQIQKLLEENQDEVCLVYQMSAGQKRERGISENGKIKQLFQGAHPSTPAEDQGSIYPGDREIHDKNNVTLQIHTLEIKDRVGNIVKENVPVIAIWFPSRLRESFIIQNQPTQSI